MAVAELSLISIVGQTGSAHRCFKDARDIARSAERSYHLVINLVSPWTLHQRGRTHLSPGDAALVDTGYEVDIDLPTSYQIVNIKFSEVWMRQWMPSPAVLVGRRTAIRKTSAQSRFR
jgi:hypothetical protein